MSERPPDVIYDWPDDADRIVEIRDAEGVRARLSVKSIMTLGRLSHNGHEWWCSSVSKCDCGADRD